MEETVQLYCDIDDIGNITRSYIGENIIPSNPFDFFTMISQEVADNIENYKVALVGMKFELVLKSAE